MAPVQATKVHLTDFLDRAEQDEHVIARTGANLIELIPDMRAASLARAAFQGSLRGQIDMSRFDDADEEIAREFGMLD